MKLKDKAKSKAERRSNRAAMPRQGYGPPTDPNVIMPLDTPLPPIPGEAAPAPTSAAANSTATPTANPGPAANPGQGPAQATPPAGPTSPMAPSSNRAR